MTTLNEYNEALAETDEDNKKIIEQEIAKVLQSNGRKDYLFGLKQEYRLYINFQQKMNECDLEIEKLLNEQINNDNEKNNTTLIKRFTKR